jgi:hypothetical protein
MSTKWNLQLGQPLQVIGRALLTIALDGTCAVLDEVLVQRGASPRKRLKPILVPNERQHFWLGQALSRRPARAVTFRRA